VAERLGFPAPILKRARTLTPDEARSLERLIAELNQTKARMEAESAAMSAARDAAERAAAEHRAALEESRTSLAEQRRRVTREGEVLLGRARELWQTVQREARRDQKSRADAATLREEIRSLEREHDALSGVGEAAPREPAPVSALQAGVRVHVSDLGVEAEVVSGPDAEGRVRLKRGSWNIESHASRLQVASAAGETKAQRPVAASWSPSDEAAPLEVDVRGMERDEAIAALDAGLDRAILAGLSEVRIVHGIGRGVLRQAVERHLRSHPQVRSQRMGQVGEGGRGVTVAAFQ
jgi:DNA mismatch repair protein MutS2